MRGTLIGDGVALRPLEEADAARIPACTNHPEVRRTFGTAPNREAKTLEWIRALDPHREQVFAVGIAEDGVCAGTCGLHDIGAVERRAMLSILIGHPERWDRGLWTAAVKLLCRHGFDTVGLRKVWLVDEIVIGLFAHELRR